MMVNMNYLQSKVTITSTTFEENCHILGSYQKTSVGVFETKLKHMIRWYYEILKHDIIFSHSETSSTPFSQNFTG